MNRINNYYAKPRYVKEPTPRSNRSAYDGRCQWHIKHPQPWTWANDHANRKTKHWNWKRITARDRLHIGNLACVPFALYKWKAFGFDGKHQPIWTINRYMEKRNEEA